MEGPRSYFETGRISRDLILGEGGGGAEDTFDSFEITERVLEPSSFPCSAVPDLQVFELGLVFF